MPFGKKSSRLDAELEAAVMHHMNRMMHAVVSRDKGEPDDDDTLEFDLGALSLLSRFHREAGLFLRYMEDSAESRPGMGRLPIRDDEEGFFHYMTGYNWACDRARQTAAEVDATATFERRFAKTHEDAARLRRLFPSSIGRD